MRVLVLGGYGLIGSAIVDRLLRDGCGVAGLGRNVAEARLRRPAVDWIKADMASMLSAKDWLPLLAGMDAVVNAAGALQNGARDDLDAVHRAAVEALVEACGMAGVRRFVQISAVGAALSSRDPFFRTKAEGDGCVMRSALSWTVLRPGLVIAPAAYGGTALLRALAAFPFVVPAVLADSPLQTVGVGDVAEAVSRAVAGNLPDRVTIDLVEERPRPLGHVLLAFRSWLGLPAARIVPVPAWIGRVVGVAADALGWLGWRSPLRGAALSAVAAGVVGDPSTWRSIAGAPLPPLETTLASIPTTVQERWFARLWLLKPVVFACLSLFWLVSGAIGLARIDAAAEVLTARGIGEGFARAAVVAGAAADIAAGVAILLSVLARPALLAMAAIAAFYLAAATLLAPDLWLDPLGPLVKVIPGFCLVLVALAILDER